MLFDLAQDPDTGVTNGVPSDLAAGASYIFYRHGGNKSVLYGDGHVASKGIPLHKELKDMGAKALTYHYFDETGARRQ